MGIQSYNRRVPSQSESATRPVAFQNHVDSLLLRGRMVARAIADDDVSCQIISKNDGWLVAQNTGAAEKGEVSSKRRNLENVGNSPDGGHDLRLKENTVPNNGAAALVSSQLENNVIYGKFDLSLLEGFGESVTPSQVAKSKQILGLKHSPLLGPNIPGVEPSAMSPNGVDPGKESSAQTKNNFLLPRSLTPLQGKADSFIPLKEEYSPASPFVFGATANAATSTISTKQIQKWKKTARVSQNYSFDVLGPETNHRVGQKRSSNAANYNFFEAGAVKRNKDTGLASAAQADDSFGDAIYCTREVDATHAAIDGRQAADQDATHTSVSAEMGGGHHLCHKP